MAPTGLGFVVSGGVVVYGGSVVVNGAQNIVANAAIMFSMGSGVNGPGSDGNGQSSGNSIEFQGKTVNQNNNLFDPDAIDSMGRTNVQRMQQGLAPIGHDGQSINLHHIDQTDASPLMEIYGSSHQQGYGTLHANTGQAPSAIDRSAFNLWRTEYWRWRAVGFG